MVVNCEEVWREISNYLEGEVDPSLRAAMEEHFRGCKHCTAVLDGTRNVIQLYGDERMLEVPLGFSQRLHRRLEENMPPSRRGFLGWMVAAAAAVLVAGSFELAQVLRVQPSRTAFGTRPTWDRRSSGHDGRGCRATERYFTRRMPVHSRQSTYSDDRGPGGDARRVTRLACAA